MLLVLGEEEGSGWDVIFILSLGCATGAVQRHPRAALMIWAAPPQNSFAADLKLALAMDYLMFALCT